MSKIDYQALREAAEKATPGRVGDRIDGSGSIKYECHGYDGSLVLRTDHKNMEYGFIGDNSNADELFFRLCVPDVILALLDELDKWQQESSAWQAVAEKQLALAEDAEKRIAELESLTAPKFTQQAPVSVPEVVGWEDVPEEITEDDIALASAWAHGFNQCRAAMLKSFGHSEQLDEVGSWNNHLNTPTTQTGNHTEQNLDMVDHFGDSNNMVEPATDNTNQQFESLSRSDK